MDVKTYFKVTAANLAFLFVGALIGPAVVNTEGIFRTVHAQGKDKPATKIEPAQQLDPNIDYVSPGVTLGGPVLTNTLIANRIACDRLEVNSFDVLRLNEAILNKLVSKGQLTTSEVQAIIEAGKAQRPLRVKP